MVFDVAYADSATVLLGVPWELTASFGSGTARGAEAILAVSPQLDLGDSSICQAYRHGIHFKVFASPVIAKQTKGLSPAEVNSISAEFNRDIQAETERILADGKKLGLVGGEHSVSFGFLQTLADRHAEFGILHFDAHLDFRRAYQGYEFSHASIMYQVMELLPAVSKMVHVAIRDCCHGELDYARRQGERSKIYFARQFHRQYISYAEIVSSLPKKVYISFDIDALDISMCPATGTPVPGGISFYDVIFILDELHKSGREVIGFDLCEVVPGVNSLDENVGARILYKLVEVLFCENKFLS